MRFARCARGALLACSAALVAACSFYPKVVIFNDTGRDLTLHVDDRDLVGWNEKRVVLGAGKAQKLVIGAIIKPTDRFTLSQGRCSYDYNLPEETSPYWDHYSDVYVVLQVEPDLRIYVRPKGRTPIPRAKLDALQAKGFPFRPVARRCA